MNSGIYKIVHRESGKCYVGSSFVIVRRWNRHKRELVGGIHPNAKLQNAWNKYGADAFDFVVIENTPESLVIAREQHWMDKLDCLANGYNIMPNAANMAGFVPDAATREKMAAAKRGIPRTAATRAKIAAYQRSKPPMDDSIRAKISAANTGSTRSDDAKLKMSIAAKARAPQSDETRAKRSAALVASHAARRASRG